MAVILGISIGNSGSGACLTVDGALRAAGREEQFSRQKADHRFPLRSIQHCLRVAGIEAGDLDYVAIADKPYLRLERELMAHIESWPSGFFNFLRAHEGMLSDKLFLTQRVRKAIGCQKPIIYCHPHEAMAAFAKWKSNLTDGAILVIDDGRLPSAVTAFSVREEKLATEFFLAAPHSPWCFLQAFADYLGTDIWESDIPGGEVYAQILDSFLRLEDDGSVLLSREFFDLSAKSARLNKRRAEKALGRRAGDPGRDRALAGAVRRHFDRAIEHLARGVARKTGCHNLLLVGIGTQGIRTLPVIHESAELKVISLPGIIGGQESLGAALFAQSNLLPPRESGPEFRPGFSAAEDKIEAFLDRAGISREACTENELDLKLKEHLGRGDTVAWMQGPADIFQFSNQLICGSSKSPKWLSLQRQLGLPPNAPGPEISPRLSSIIGQIRNEAIQVAAFESNVEPAPARPQDAYRFFLNYDIDWLVLGNSLIRKRKAV